MGIHQDKRGAQMRKETKGVTIMTFEELLNSLSTAYKHPDEMDADRNGNTRMSVLQERFNLSSLKIQKLLVTAGVYEPVKENTPFATIQGLRSEGKSAKEIQAITGLSNASVNAYLPYEMTPHNAELLGVELGNDAERKRRQRSNEEMRKENMRGILNRNLTDEAFWKAIQEHDQETFITASGERYHVNAIFGVFGRAVKSPAPDASTAQTASTVQTARHIEKQQLFIVAEEDGSVLTFKQEDVFKVLHDEIENDALKSDTIGGLVMPGDAQEADALNSPRPYVIPLLIYFGIIDGDREATTTKRSTTPRACSCCGRIDAPLNSVSSYAELLELGSQFEKKRRDAMQEDEKSRVTLIEADPWLVQQREKYEKQIEAAKNSKVVKAFDAEGERQFCELCAETIRMALEKGDPPYISTIGRLYDVPADLAESYLNQTLIPTTETWVDRYDKRYTGERLFREIDADGVEHYFMLTSSRFGGMMSFEGVEVHRLTKAGKMAKNNSDTDYEIQHLRTLYADSDPKQVRLSGLLELMEKITAALQSPSITEGRLRDKGTIIPVCVSGTEMSGPVQGEYGLMIDGKLFSGDDLVRMLQGYEGAQIQFQIKDPSDDVLRGNEYLMPVRLGEKQLVDDTLELLRLFTENGEFISDHDQENFSHLFEEVLKKLKLYHESNPRGYGKLAGMGMIKALEMYEGTEWEVQRVQEIIR